jgi:hypothetical protein
MLRHVSALDVDHIQGAHMFLARAAYASPYKAGILHMIEIIMKIQYHNS